MDGIERSRMWKSLKQRLGLKRMGCCGAIFGPARAGTTAAPTITIIETLNMDDEYSDPDDNGSRRSSTFSAPFVSQVPSAAGMNLAMALAAERNLRGTGPDAAAAVGRVKTLMALIEETDGVDLKVGRRRRERRGGAGGGCDGVCCVCMERNKGAAFIPCGHTFCRACSRELWIGRGSCPICNRSILEILDIF
ncbi:uncharacterized protein LOC116204046 [Punica granatum]|uniref:Uncharacterized protein LOC116204046 n=2 Tax=Punica granatum TaxID=22663 RepID=A0A6P8D5X6_PUNGR|nr:uncharacterized protein LOC116204046 [Punica granatum]XP_031391948.1 uncharacterized protein LOC116204046 [Punica granatum]XP_031391950.1 uncharacterized protein LOC116204046 [Punica granatum]OWM79792.1 hypothetical protein CDL15_Pgr023204 [Punica granatum]PKI54349.1 hypothetical protein CRG98_025235 [Punica granatum]